MPASVATAAAKSIRHVSNNYNEVRTLDRRCARKKVRALSRSCQHVPVQWKCLKLLCSSQATVAIAATQSYSPSSTASTCCKTSRRPVSMLWPTPDCRFARCCDWPVHVSLLKLQVCCDTCVVVAFCVRPREHVTTTHSSL